MEASPTSPSANPIRTPSASVTTMLAARSAVTQPTPSAAPSRNAATMPPTSAATPAPTRGPLNANAPPSTATSTSTLPTSNLVGGTAGGRGPSATSATATAANSAYGTKRRQPAADGERRSISTRIAAA